MSMSMDTDRKLQTSEEQMAEPSDFTLSVVYTSSLL